MHHQGGWEGCKTCKCQQILAPVSETCCETPQLRPVPHCEQATMLAHTVVPGYRWSAANTPVLPLPDSLLQEACLDQPWRLEKAPLCRLT